MKKIVLVILCLVVFCAAIVSSAATPASKGSVTDSSTNKALYAKFYGTWEFNENGDKSYFKISKVGNHQFKFTTGNKYQGKIIWQDVMLKNTDGIYLKPSEGKLKGKFVSGNFYATHGQDFTYKITITLKSDNKVLYSVNSSIRGETEMHEATKVNE